MSKKDLLNDIVPLLRNLRWTLGESAEHAQTNMLLLALGDARADCANGRENGSAWPPLGANNKFRARG